MKELWVEKYRPKTVEGYVFRDDAQRKQVATWINDKSIPHLLFSGNAGIGKTTLAKLLFNELDLNPLDILEINASRTNGVDEVRNKIVSFVQMIPFGDFKVVLLDEADYLSPNAQAALRGVMEEYHTTARFILTCNYPNRIIPAIHSRTQGFHIAKIDQTEFTARVATILITEGITPDLDTLDTYVKATYPDLRKCINMIQQNIVDNNLVKPSEGDSGAADWKLEMVELFKARKISEARKLLCGKVRAEEMEEIYRWLYDNIELFGSEDKQDAAVLTIKQGLVDHTLVVDPEINLAATLIRLGAL
jgi:replication factor C small subunit|tara:strand:+ start:561 stop:1475 length:915 start_codon:yes stop_codon:yes gene_type:complete